MTAVLLLSPFVLLLLFSTRTQATTVLVRSRDEECYWENVPEGQKMHHSFALASGKAEINMKVYGPDDSVILSLPGADEESFTFVAQEEGPYTWCYENNGRDMITV